MKRLKYIIKQIWNKVSWRKTIYYSQDERWYYILEEARIDSYWASTKKFYDKPTISPIFQGLLKITPKNKKTYYRVILPFIFSKVRSHKREVVHKTHELVLDYGNGII